MSLFVIVISPFIAGMVAWGLSRTTSGRGGVTAGRLVMAAGLLLPGFLALSLWPAVSSAAGMPIADAAGGAPSYAVEAAIPWIPQLGATIHLGADGLALLMVFLTVLLGLAAMVVSWKDDIRRPGFFLFNLGLILSGVFGVFLSVDLFLFFLFWELMLVPMYFLIAIWGSEKRRAAALKFFIFTQASGLVMLLSILTVYFVHGNATGTYTFDLPALVTAPLTGAGATLAMIGFLLAFGVKLPVVPFHPWLPDAHTEAPTAGSILLAGLLLKTGAYGLIRFIRPLFPVPFSAISPVLMTLAVVSIIYGAVLAYRQSDFKRLVAYTSISHMGFVLLGVASGTVIGFQGAIIAMLAHGFTTSALFATAGFLKDRLHSRALSDMGGMKSVTPRLAGFGIVFWVFALGFPGSANFMGEFLVLLGTFKTSVAFSAVAASGLVLSVIYSLRAVRAAFHGPVQVDPQTPDLTFRETALVLVMAALVLWIGLFPGRFLSLTQPMAQTHHQLVVQKGGNP